jgi:hypothetical protein
MFLKLAGHYAFLCLDFSSLLALEANSAWLHSSSIRKSVVYEYPYLFSPFMSTPGCIRSTPQSQMYL